MKYNFSVNNFTKPMRTPEKVNFFRVKFFGQKLQKRHKLMLRKR